MHKLTVELLCKMLNEINVKNESATAHKMVVLKCLKISCLLYEKFIFLSAFFV